MVSFKFPTNISAMLLFFISGILNTSLSINNANAAGYFVEIQNNSTSWMESIADEIADKDLREIILPGTHDTGSREKTGWGTDHLYETQNYTVKQQLDYGIRYLDFRVTYNSGDNAWIFSHAGGDMEDKVYPALDDIKTFLDTHTKEIVIIDFQHFPELSDGDDQAHLPALRTKLMTTLGSCMVPSSMGVHTKLQTLWDNNKRVIVIMTGSVYSTFSGSEQTKLWEKSASIESPWPGVSDEEDAIRYLDGKITTMNAGYDSQNPKYYDKFYVMQGISTASKTGASLWDGANDTNPAILAILEGNNVPLVSNDWRNSPLNIVIVDYVDTIDLTPVVKSMNMDSIKNGTENLDDGVYLYEHPDYGGYFIRLNENCPNFTKRFIVDQAGYDDHNDFNNKIGSVRIVGEWGVRLYRDSNFGGTNMRIIASTPELGTYNNDGGSARVYKTAYIPCDVSGDNTVDLVDTVLALQIVSGKTPSSDVYNQADIDGDDKIGMAEIIGSLKIVSGE